MAESFTYSSYQVLSETANDDEPSCSNIYEVLSPECFPQTDKMAESFRDPELQNLSNYNPDPLDMSEIRVVLLGNSLSERIAAVNFILEVPLFSREEEPDYTPVRGLFNDLELVLINTPDVLDPNMSEDKLTEFMENCVRLSTPGPHVFLLVLQPEDFTEEHDQRLHRVLKLFADRPFDHALVLLSIPKTKALHFMKKNRLPPCLKDLIKVCDYRFLWRKNLEHQQLFTCLIQLFKKNNGEHVKCKAGNR